MALPDDPDLQRILELVAEGKLRYLGKRPYVVNGVELTEFMFHDVDNPGHPIRAGVATHERRRHVLEALTYVDILLRSADCPPELVGMCEVFIEAAHDWLSTNR